MAIIGIYEDATDNQSVDADLSLVVYFARLSKIKGEIPSYKLIETDLSFVSEQRLANGLTLTRRLDSFSFLDISPLSRGHALVIPKYHAAKMHELPDEYLADMMPLAKKIANAQGLENYNVLQNNGRIAHQVVDHVHFHIIPKPSASNEEGLVIGWPAMQISKEDLQELRDEVAGKL